MNFLGRKPESWVNSQEFQSEGYVLAKVLLAYTRKLHRNREQMIKFPSKLQTNPLPEVHRISPFGKKHIENPPFILYCSFLFTEKLRD